MNLFKDKKAVLKFSFLILGIAAITAIIIYAVLVSAATHVSTVEITSCTTIGGLGECIIAGGVDDHDFDLKVCNDAGSTHEIHEFRIYYEWEGFTDFSDVDCKPKTGWYGPYIITGIWGEFCLYTSTSSGNNIVPGNCADFEFTADTPETDCCRELRFETRDINDEWMFVDADVCVDAKDPTTIKTFDGPKKIDGDVEWIDGVTKIVLTATDPDPHPSEVKETKYVNILAEEFVKTYGLGCDPETPCWDYSYCQSLAQYGDDIPEGWWQTYDVPFQKEGESCHVLFYYSEDNVGNKEDMQVNCFFVDLTPPYIDKNNGEAIPGTGEDAFKIGQNSNGDFHWITTSMPITFTCDDTREPTGATQAHPSEGEKLCFKVSYDHPDWDYITERYCDTSLNDEGYCCVPVDPITKEYIFYFQEESMHDLEYYCEDAVEKKTDVEIQYYKVDDTPPKITKTMIGDDHLGDCPPEDPSDECYVADHSGNGVRIDVEDVGEICVVDRLGCNYELWWETDLQTCIDEFGGTHLYNEQTGECFVEGNPLFGEEGANVIFTEDSKHRLIINCWDALGNHVEDIEEFLVDSKPPKTTKTIGDPKYLSPPGCVEGQCKVYIDGVTEITLTCVDEKVGQKYPNKIYYKYTVDGVLVQDWREYTGPFSFPEESVHELEYYCVDALGNEEEHSCVAGREKNCETDYVDHTPPVTTKTYGTPKYPDTDHPNWISSDTEITLTANDPDPTGYLCNSGVKEKQYRVSGALADNFCENCENWMQMLRPDMGDWQTYTGPFTIGEDSCHVIEYRSIDNVNKTEDIKWQCVFVDNKKPEITKTLEGPYVGDCDPADNNPDDGECIIDGTTKIHVEVTDPDPHPVDAVKCAWYYYLDGGGDMKGGGQELTPPFDITFPEESTHVLTIKCKDALGNEVVDVETFLVDKTGPRITKTYEGPYYEEQEVEWINSKTKVIISVDDLGGPHNSGVKETKYRYDLVEDGYCDPTNTDYLCENAVTTKDWTTLSDPVYGEFSIPDDSCHYIEIISTDNVEKSSTHKQCVFVDNTPPEPNKTVEEPKTEWYPVDVASDPFDPDATHFYPWIVDKCWSEDPAEMIDCWKVTLDTKITMNCTDPDPHPVDHEKVCFQVEMDGEDVTDRDGCVHKWGCGFQKSYCDKYNGEMVDGWCCVDYTIKDFTFKEESEHNLKYYCIDALGNNNSENYDEEKFKVTGEMFKIRINDKWNLISVPFVLLNDSPQEVFEDTPSVQTVWGYDENGDWHVYRPAGDYIGTNNLEHIEPGYGYWVLADCEEPADNSENHRCGCGGPDGDKCEMLIVGGSLYNPGPVTPPNVKVGYTEEGWNLIGYYGTENRWGYKGPNEWYGWWSKGKDTYCALYSLRNLNEEESTKWSALIGYWEPDNPRAWYELEMCDEMDPGAGYWISMDAEGNYKPATICDEEVCKGWDWSWIPGLK